MGRRGWARCGTHKVGKPLAVAPLISDAVDKLLATVGAGGLVEHVADALDLLRRASGLPLVSYRTHAALAECKEVEKVHLQQAAAQTPHTPHTTHHRAQPQGRCEISM